MRIRDWSSDVCSSDLMPIAAATDDLDDLDELIQEVAEWLSQFKSLAVMAKLAKINSEFMELRSDGQTDIPADRLKFYQAVQSRSSLFTTLQDSILKIGRASCRERVCQYV